MDIKKIDYKIADELAKNYMNCEGEQDTIMGIFFVREGCGACEYMLEESLPNVTAPEGGHPFRLFKMEIHDDEHIPFPPLRTPIAYFYIPNCVKVPVMREGVAPVDMIEHDLRKMIEVANGADYYKVFFPDTPEERIPEHEKQQ